MLALILALLGAGEPAAPRLVPDQAHASFGESYQGATVQHTFYLVNGGERPVTILKAEARSGAADARFTVKPAVVPPGGTAEVHVEQPLGDRLGQVSFRYRVTTDGPGDPPVRFSLSGFSQSAYIPEQLFVDMGVVDPRTGGSKVVDLASDETARLEILGVDGATGGLSVAVAGRTGEADEGVRLDVRLAAGAGLGPFRRRVKLSTNVAHQPSYEAAVTGSVYGDVVPSRSPLEFGGGKPGALLSATLALHHRSGAAFRVVQILDLSNTLTFELEPCGDPPVPGCLRVRASLVPVKPGPLGGEIVVELEEGETLPLPWSATVFPAGTDLRMVGGAEEP